MQDFDCESSQILHNNHHFFPIRSFIHFHYDAVHSTACCLLNIIIMYTDNNKKLLYVVKPRYCRQVLAIVNQFKFEFAV